MAKNCITGITRVRNESLIIEDTLNHFLGYVDSILLYDDCSTDNTVEIARDFANVEVIYGDEWRLDRDAEETRHRQLLIDMAVDDWLLCFDADERLVGDLPDLTADAYTFRLFDGYMTENNPYERGRLDSLPRMFGPEYRDITMLFRADKARFDGRSHREPTIRGRTEQSDVLVKHYGKCLSIGHWEETCDYYAAHFPQWSAKWRARKGKAIHNLSDFGRPLYTFEGAVANGVPI